MIGIIFIFLITLAIFSSKKEKNEKDTEQSQKGKKGEQEFSEKNIISYTSKKESYYNILGVSENASPEEIKKAYREKAMRYHPDHNSNKEKAEIEFRRIKEAYDILKDEKKRKEYDFLNARIYEDRNIFKTKNDNYVYREYFREKLIREVFYDENRLNCIEKSII